MFIVQQSSSERRSRDRWPRLLQDESELSEIGRPDSHVVQSPAVLQTEMQGLLLTDMQPHLCMWGFISEEKSMIHLCILEKNATTFIQHLFLKLRE